MIHEHIMESYISKGARAETATVPLSCSTLFGSFFGHLWVREPPPDPFVQTIAVQSGFWRDFGKVQGAFWDALGCSGDFVFRPEAVPGRNKRENNSKTMASQPQRTYV